MAAEEEASTVAGKEEHRTAVEAEGSTAEEAVADKPSVAEEEGKASVEARTASVEARTASVEARKASAEEVAAALEVAAQE